MIRLKRRRKREALDRLVLRLILRDARLSELPPDEHQELRRILAEHPPVT